MNRMVVALSLMLVAGPAIAQGPSPVDPYGGTNSGAGRLAYGGSIVDPSWPKPNSGAGHALAMFPTIVDPNGPNSGAGHTMTACAVAVDPYCNTTSGAGHILAAWPTIVDPNGPNSGTGYAVAMFPTIVDPNGPNSGAGHGLV